VVVVVVVAGIVVRGVVARARRAVYMRVAMCMIVARIAVRSIVVRAHGTVPMCVAVCMVVIVPLTVAAMIMVVAARCGVAVRVLAGRRHLVGNGRRVRVARVGAARVGAAGMAVSWVVGTLGVGHDNLLYGLTV